MAIVLAMSLSGCLGEDDPGPESRTAVPCLGPPARAEAGPAVVALLGDPPDDPDELGGPVNRLLRISLPGGEVETERPLGPRWGPGDAAQLDSLRLREDAGPQLAVTPDGGSVVALVRYPVAGRAVAAVIDARTLRIRCIHPLERGVRYSGLLLGRSGTLYAIGVRRAGRSRWDSVLTMTDADTGELLGSRTLRAADQTLRVRSGKDWWAYRAALSQDERRLVVSYHGGDTTGADAFRLPPGEAVRRATDGMDSGWAHGAVSATAGGFVAATGGHEVLRLDRAGRERGRIRLRGHLGHLMDFEVDRRRRLLYAGACGARPGILRVDLAGARRRKVPSGDFCGIPLAVHDDRFVVLDATRAARSGFPSSRDEGLRLLDLERPGAGRPVPRSARALDAVVVGTRR